MADNVTLPGTGVVIAADDVSSVWYQQVKLVSGTLGETAAIPGDATYGLDVDVTRLPTLATVTAVTDITNPVAVKMGGFSVDVVPTLSVHATYVANDYVGESATAMTFAGCGRANGLSGKITGAVLIDYALQSVAGELWMFDLIPTPPDDSAAWTISDAHAARCIGVIPFNTYYGSALNSVAPVGNLSIPFKCAAAATALYGCFVTRGAPAYASGDLTFRLYIDQD